MGQQQIRLSCEPQGRLAPMADEAEGLDLEPVGGQAGDTKGQVPLRRGLDVLTVPDDQVPEPSDVPPVERHDLRGPDGVAIRRALAAPPHPIKVRPDPAGSVPTARGRTVEPHRIHVELRPVEDLVVHLLSGGVKGADGPHADDQDEPTEGSSVQIQRSSAVAAGATSNRANMPVIM